MINGYADHDKGQDVSRCAVGADDQIPPGDLQRGVGAVAPSAPWADGRLGGERCETFEGISARRAVCEALPPGRRERTRMVLWLPCSRRSRRKTVVRHVVINHWAYRLNGDLGGRVAGQG